MRRSVLLGTGSALPARVVTNAELAQTVDTSDEWIVERTGIRTRYIAGEGETTTTLATDAAKRALDAAGLAAQDIDLIILATDTPDYLSPSTASIVQHKLGATRAGTFDVNAACSAFVIGLDMGAKYIAADPRYNNILVLGGYTMSRHLNRDDKKTVTLFADGAGAVLLQASEGEDRGFRGARLHTEGQYHDWMGIYGGGTRRPVTPQVLEERGHQLVFAKKFPKEINPLTWTRMVKALTGDLGLSPLQIDHYVFTQLNIHSIWETLDNLGVPRERGHTIMDRVGYTGSACIPMAFDDLVRGGGTKPGDTVCFVASGGGLSFATAIFDL